MNHCERYVITIYWKDNQIYNLISPKDIIFKYPVRTAL
jgi:hypothetical protein